MLQEGLLWSMLLTAGGSFYYLFVAFPRLQIHGEPARGRRGRGEALVNSDLRASVLVITTALASCRARLAAPRRVLVSEMRALTEASPLPGIGERTTAAAAAGELR